MTQTYYHGTNTESAENLREHGIREAALQTRDRGFFGDGFYVTESREIASQHADTVAEYRDDNGEIVQFQLNPDADVFCVEINGHNPTTVPEWHDEFIGWVEDTLKEAAVWEKIQGVTEDRILTNGVAERTPGDETFDAEKWRRDVTAFAKDEGYAAVRWAEGEIVIVDFESGEFR